MNFLDVGMTVLAVIPLRLCVAVFFINAVMLLCITIHLKLMHNSSHDIATLQKLVIFKDAHLSPHERKMSDSGSGS